MPWSRGDVGSGEYVRTPEEVMEVLEACDLTGSYRAAAALAVVTTAPLRATWRDEGP
jgi:hypothetical protein